MLEATPAPSIFTQTSRFSLIGVASLGLIAYTASRTFLPKTIRWQDRFAFIWLVRALHAIGMRRLVTRCIPSRYDTNAGPQIFDALIHFIFEGSFLWLSTFGRQVNTSTGMFAEMCTFLAMSPSHASSPLHMTRP